MNKRLIISIICAIFISSMYAQRKLNFEKVYKAAIQGDADAQARLSYLYLTRHDSIDGEDLIEAHKWAEKAANQGHAMGAYIFGEVLTMVNEFSEAYKYYLMAAEKGVLDACYEVGSSYYIGRGVKKDLAESFKWYLKAAEGGFVNAQVQVGFMYSNGLGTEENLDESFRWTKMAAEAGSAVAQANMSWNYFEGLGTDVDYELAYFFAKESANQNEELGYENLANCYLIGSNRNYLKAIECMDKAIELCQKSGRADADSTYLLRMYNKKGCIYLIENNFTKAKEMAKLILDINPQYIDEEDNSLMTYIKTGKNESERLTRLANIDDSKIRFVDWIIRPKYEYAGPFIGPLALVKEVGKKYGYININGEYIVKPQYDAARNFREGFAAVGKLKNGQIQWNFIDGKKERPLLLFTAIEVLEVYDFCGGYAAFRDSHGKWGFVNQRGLVQITARYETGGYFINGVALVKLGSIDTFIDENGELICSETHKSKRFFEMKNEYDKALKEQKIIWAEITPIKFANRWGHQRLSLEGYINSNLEPWDTYSPKRIAPLESYEQYIKPRIETAINNWQRKGEFERTSDWKIRVNESTRQQKINELTEIFKAEYGDKLSEYKIKYTQIVNEYKVIWDDLQKTYYNKLTSDKIKKFALNRFELMAYDADNQSFMIKSDNQGDILMPVPLEDAPSFKQNWNVIKNMIIPTFTPSGDDVVLTSVTVINGNKKYVYDSHTQAKYAVTDINYNFDPVEISVPEVADVNYTFDPVEVIQSSVVQTSPTVKGLQVNNATIERKRLDATRQSDVDINIPQNEMDENSNTFVVIIANENYQRVSHVDYAVNDGIFFAEYCQKTLGIPQQHIMMYNDATLGNMLGAINRIKEIGEAYNGKANIIFYYAGHGIPDEESKDAFLLPVDGNASSPRTCYKQSELYSELANIKAKSVMVFMDACFSGAQRGDGMLMASRGVAIKAKSTNPLGNMVVFSAAQGDETAYPYKEQKHGMFTYYLLKKLQETKGDVTLGELSDYVTAEVKKTSIVANGKMQTPTLLSSPQIANDWRNWKLR